MTLATNPNFDAKWTARAVRILRNVEGNVEQAREEYGSVENGEACATQVLFDLLDDLRNSNDQQATLEKWLPVSVGQIINWNDEDELSFSEIADRIERAAGLN
jgi:hypothetical protein